MDDDSQISRRTFGQVVGAAAAVGAVQAFAAAGPVDQSTRPATATARAADQLCELSALELAARIRRKDVSARDVMAAHLARIERVNPK